MGHRAYLLILFLFVLIFGGCGTTHQDVKTEGNFVLKPEIRIKVEDVTNDTGQVTNVDMIGLFWSALENALKKDDLLWSQASGSAPLKLEAHILKYKKGHALQRWLMPGMGSTILEARVDLKNGNEVVASIEVHRSVSLGDGLTIGGWEKIFKGAAEEVVEEIRVKMRG